MSDNIIGKEILHYKVIEKLGEGGMGIVYLAEDTKLDRRVAIKSLPNQIAANSAERERFKIEAKAAASLNHPNIATIHNIEETDEGMFIVMEYIDGQELKSVVDMSGPTLPVSEIVRYALQIAKGLNAAHSKNIVHRDIKSTNIMLTKDGQIKIMDFGLAKVSGSEQLTREGTTIGTAAYMSPEQARHQSVDPRSDIWSFGIILYEMLSGKLPFSGDYEAAILYDILHVQPPMVHQLNTSVPEKLSFIVHRCLEKDHTKRYQSADDIIKDLEAIKAEEQWSKQQADSTEQPIQTVKKEQTVKKTSKIPLFVTSLLIIALIVVAFIYFGPSDLGPVATDKKMLVVLPFNNLGAAEQDYFADGITGEITSRLSGLSGLGVIARSSAMQYKNTTKSLSQIGEELGVQYMLEGTIQWENSDDGSKRVRVNPELIQIENGTQIWSKPYVADFSGVFQLQAEIATQVATAMNVTLLADEEKSIQLKLTSNSDAYDYYLRGLDYFEDTFDKERWIIARQMFEQAIKLDPGFAAAYASLSQLHSDVYWFHYDRSDKRLKMALDNIQKAEQLDPDLYIVWKAKGWYYYHGLLEYENALIEFNKSLEIKPDDSDTYMGIASVLRRQGKMEEAVEFFNKAIETNPRSPQNYGQVGETVFLLRRYDEARTYLEKGFSMAPDDPYNYTYWVLATLNLHKNIEEATRQLEEHLHLAGSSDLANYIYTLTWLDIMNRKFDSALNRFEENFLLNSQFHYIPGILLRARIYDLKNAPQKAKESYISAQKLIEAKISENPQDPRLYSALGIIHAGLGQKEEAIRQGRRGIDLMPIKKEAWRGAFQVQYLAIIYTMLGEQEKAVKLLDQLLALPFDLSVTLLELDPTWDPLRNHPQFQALLKKYTPAI